MARQRLVYQDFRPIREGEPGYAPSRRLYISPSTGEVISLRQFQRGARGMTYTAYKYKKEVLEGKPPKKYKKRRTREEIIRDNKKKLQEKRTKEREKQAKIDDKKNREVAKQYSKSNVMKGYKKRRGHQNLKEYYQDRFILFKQQYIKKYNSKLKDSKQKRMTLDTDITDNEFYRMYDIAVNPSEYTDNEWREAWDYFDLDLETYDYPWGDTP
jgi:hypothetical protein